MARVAATPESLIDGDDVDAVAICSSTDTHIDLLVAAAGRRQAGVHREAALARPGRRSIVASRAVDAAGIAVQVGFNRRFDPSHRSVRDRVLDGDIGDVHLCRITSRDPAPPPISYIEVSGGIFNDMTIHDFDMARYVTGSEVVDVFAHGAVLVDQAIGAAGDFDTVVVTMRHENGAITTIDNSRQAVYGYDQRVEVFGSGGMAMSDNPLDDHDRVPQRRRRSSVDGAVLLPRPVHPVVRRRVGGVPRHGPRRDRRRRSPMRRRSGTARARHRSGRVGP